MGRPAGVVGRTQLKQDDLVRIQTLSRDARMGPSEIRRVTGYSIHQIKYALKKKTPTVGKRSGRPRKSAGGGGSGNGSGSGSGSGSGDGKRATATATTDGLADGADGAVVDGGSEGFDGGGVGGSEGSSGVEADEDVEGMGVDLEAAAGGSVQSILSFVK